MSLCGCPNNPDSVVLKITGDAPAAYVDVYLRDDASGAIFFHNGFVPVATGTSKDISQPGQVLTLGVLLTGGGGHRLTVLLVGAKGDMPSGAVPDADKQMFWAGHVTVAGTTVVDAKLLTVDVGQDADRDLWPDAVGWPQVNPAAQALYAQSPSLLDCADKPAPSLPSTLTPADINPFAKERCSDHYDTDCNGMLAACTDGDNDGDPSDTDCDDSDAARHHANPLDPFPDPPNCCGYSLGKANTPDQGTNYLYAAGDPGCKASSCQRDSVLCPSVRCGDGVDESCSNKDTTCIVDNDCDGYVGAADCDDNDPTTYRGAPETCADTKDKNCDGLVGAGCVPCDLDGDGYQRSDPANDCKPPAGMVDCNDYDAATHPNSTIETTPLTGGANMGSGKEGGTSLVNAVIAALRGTCRPYYDNAGMHPKIAGPSNALVGDADCDGTAYAGCPSPACDADGDGYPNAGAGCAIAGVATDCNDANPAIFPNAPDKCGDGVISNCGTTDTACASGTDSDGDGYTSSVDCDDHDANTHPFAPELCDGKDNDCDGLVDEGNPDALGAPLVNGTAIASCTTSDVGECAKTKGACVCSKAPTGIVYDPHGMRTFCPTEMGSTGAIKPECYGSGQPKPQSCNATNPKDDDCDGSVDNVDGTKIAETGQPCGIAVGQCTAGTITGCDKTKANCFVSFGLLPPDKAWLTCSTDAVCPRNEICNGFDDDCNGIILSNEQDSDHDNYMACLPTVAPLKAGLLGGGDCNDGNAAIHPGATERCNGQIDDCNLTSSDAPNPHGDGVGPTGECTPLGDACCPSGCRNTNTDINNCGACNHVCTPNVADHCAGACMCGTGPSCDKVGAGLTCIGGSCFRMPGQTCAANAQCTTGLCQNHCCQTACPPTCDDSPNPSVSSVFNDCDSVGACVATKTQCTAGYACNGPACSTACTGSGPGGSGNHCKSGYRCDGSGSCVQCTNSSATACGTSCIDCTAGVNLACLSGTCGCNSDADCPSNRYCNVSHQCDPQLGFGVFCSQSNCAVFNCRQCATGMCPPSQTCGF